MRMLLTVFRGCIFGVAMTTPIRAGAPTEKSLKLHAAADKMTDDRIHDRSAVCHLSLDVTSNDAGIDY